MTDLKERIAELEKELDILRKNYSAKPGWWIAEKSAFIRGQIIILGEIRLEMEKTEKGRDAAVSGEHWRCYECGDDDEYCEVRLQYPLNDDDTETPHLCPFGLRISMWKEVKLAAQEKEVK